jgi:hypothetical protein
MKYFRNQAVAKKRQETRRVALRKRASRKGIAGKVKI